MTMCVLNAVALLASFGAFLINAYVFEDMGHTALMGLSLALATLTGFMCLVLVVLGSVGVSC